MLKGITIYAQSKNIMRTITESVLRVCEPEGQEVGEASETWRILETGISGKRGVCKGFLSNPNI